MAPVAGWYADPRDAGRLRYWDGTAWTEHVAPSAASAPAPAPSTTPALGPPAEQTATGAAHWTYPASPPAQQQRWEYGAPAGQQQYGTAASSREPRTPDGVPITTWFKRLAARLLDGIFVLLLSLPFTGYFLYRYAQAVADQMDETTSLSLVPSDEVLRWELPIALILLVFQGIYEAVSLRKWSATPGKRVLGISVRLLAAPGRLTWSVIGRRVGFLYGLSLLSLVPIVSYIAALVWLLDYLWPLWNKPRQALHDKAAATVVVEGPSQQQVQPQP